MPKSYYQSLRFESEPEHTVNRSRRIRKKSVIEQLERTAEVAVEEEVVVCEEPYTNQFEKELKRIMKDSNYSNVSMIYKKFYAQAQKPEAIEALLK